MRKAIDPQLLTACAAHDRRAQRELYDRSFPHLNFMVSRYLREGGGREDVLQETYLRIFQHLASFDPKRASFATWSGRIAINCCLKRNVAAQRGQTETFRNDRHDRPQAPLAIDRLTDAELLRWLQRMPADQYLVFSMCAIDGYTHAEIAAELGIGVALSRQRLSRARRWLRDALERDDAPLFHRLRNRNDLQLAPLIALLYLLTKI